MTRQAISTTGAPGALGPYSQGIASDGFVFCSGQIGIDPASGELADGIEAQTDRALRNLSAVLDAAGATLEDVVKTTIFLADIGDFAAVNAVYATPHAGPAARPLDLRRRRAAEGRPGRDRDDRPAPDGPLTRTLVGSAGEWRLPAQRVPLPGRTAMSLRCGLVPTKALDPDDQGSTVWTPMGRRRHGVRPRELNNGLA